VSADGPPGPDAAASDRVLVTPPPVGTEPPPDVGARAEASSPPAPGDAATPSATVSTPYGLAPVDVGAAPAALLAVSADGARLVATPQPDARTADGYLRMTARILLEFQKQDLRSIGVVSAFEGEGRTAAAVNLAVCLGRAKGRVGRVLLVDGDPRHRALTRMFCGNEAPHADGGGRPHPMLIGTALEGVDLMTAPVLDDGLTVTSPAAWIATFRELGAMYPHIVVDCPAVLENPEGMVLRECVQQIVLVARAGRSTRSVVRKTLGQTAARVLGVILNGAPPGAAAETWR
jgi:Mrp family chromosome partitioning ATPase